MRKPTREETMLARLRAICLAFPEASEIATFGHPTFRVARKPFAVFEEHRGELTLALKVTPLDGDVLLHDPRFFATPYVGQHGWVSLRMTGAIDWGEVEELLLASYRTVAPKKALAALRGRGARA